MIPPALALHQVQFRWPKQPVPCINIAHLELTPGEQVFLHGPSGSGKSTLLNLIAGTLLPQQGELHCLGQALPQLTRRARDQFRGAHLGYVFQQFNLLPYASVLDNVLLPCHFSPYRQQRACALDGSSQAAAQRLLLALDIQAALFQQPAYTLSVGQQQRVAVARALIGQPEMIIADEPTSALDAARQTQFLDLLLHEARQSGCTLLFASHDLRLSPHFQRNLSLPDLNQAASPMERQDAIHLA